MYLESFACKGTKMKFARVLDDEIRCNLVPNVGLKKSNVTAKNSYCAVHIIFWNLALL